MADTGQFDVNRLFSTKGFVCVVTGGGTGIGLMATQALAANGAKVYITGRRMEALEQAAKQHNPKDGGGQIIPIGPCDVTKKDDLQKLVGDLQSREQYINLLMVNAGITGPKTVPDNEDADALKEKLWDNESVDDWQSAFQTLVTAVYFTTVAFLPLLQAAIKPHGPLEAFGASVITTSSMSGLMRDAQGHFAYNSETFFFIIRHSHTKVTCSCQGCNRTPYETHELRIPACFHSGQFHCSRFAMKSNRACAPIHTNNRSGYFPSELTDRNKDSDERQKSEFPQEKIENYGHVPIVRPGREEEMAMTVLYLAKNHYVNGEIIAVDGGVLNVVPGR